jgi:hypothetical protein
MAVTATLRARARSASSPRPGFRSIQCCILLAALLVLAACGGGGLEPEPPSPSALHAVSFGANSVRLAAGPGSADAGTNVSATAGAAGTGTVDSDGSFSFDAVVEAGAAAITVQYAKEGYTLASTSTPAPLASRVTKPLFATGAGPNDMVYAGGSLYIANSLDNTVVRYYLDGSVMATASFDPGASPSYLGIAPGTLWVTCNGSNEVVGLVDLDLTERAGFRYQLTGAGTAFIGPSEPAIIDGRVFVPRNEIATFGPTAYGPGKVAVLGPGAAAGEELLTTGLNPQFSAVAYRGYVQLLYATCGGDIQFNEDWQPYAASDSYLELLWDASGILPPRALNLGPIGAGRIALEPAGYTALIGSALAANLYAVDLDSFTVLRGADDPIVLTEDYSFTSDVAFAPGGKYALALSFNTDELYVLDTATWEPNPGPYPEPFDLALGEGMLAGAANLEIAPDPEREGHFAAYVLYGVGNAVAKVELF